MTSPVCIPNKPLLGSCLSERVRCTGIKMLAESEYDKLKDAHDAIADGDHPTGEFGVKCAAGDSGGSFIPPAIGLHTGSICADAPVGLIRAAHR